MVSFVVLVHLLHEAVGAAEESLHVADALGDLVDGVGLERDLHLGSARHADGHVHVQERDVHSGDDFDGATREPFSVAGVVDGASEHVRPNEAVLELDLDVSGARVSEDHHVGVCLH